MNKILNRITTLLFLVLLFGFSLLFLILPDQSFSAEENRSLRTFPRFSWESLASGRFSEEINDYFADQFPWRDAFVGVKGISELCLGKGENDGILLGKDGQLAQRRFDVLLESGETLDEQDAFDPAAVQAAMQGLDRAAQNMSVPFHVLLTGRAIDVTASSFAYPASFSVALRECVQTSMPDSVTPIETIPILQKMHDMGESVYYRTDHHWTTNGAYVAYVETMRSFGMEDEILPRESFERVTVSTDFYGTAWSAGGMKFVAPDQVEFWLVGNEDEFVVTADGKEIDGLYNRDYLNKKDKYSAFLDGTHDVVTVTKPGEERPTLLLLKDSFANALAPFLAQHFDLVLLNLSSARTDYTDLSHYADVYGADRVLLIYTLENVITADRLQRLH